MGRTIRSSEKWNSRAKRERERERKAKNKDRIDCLPVRLHQSVRVREFVGWSMDSLEEMEWAYQFHRRRESPRSSIDTTKHSSKTSYDTPAPVVYLEFCLECRPSIHRRPRKRPERTSFMDEPLRRTWTLPTRFRQCRSVDSIPESNSSLLSALCTWTESRLNRSTNIDRSDCNSLSLT